MSQHGLSSQNWKIFNKKPEDRYPIFIGNFGSLNEYLAEKPSNSPWLLFQFLNCLCRSFGQVIFANNPISGVIIMIAIGIANYNALLAGLFASTISFVFALSSGQDSDAILNGAYGFNPVLHGVVSVGALPNIYSDIQVSSPKFYLFLFLTAVLSVYVTSALNSLFKHMGKYTVPAFTLPFNILQFILIFCILNNSLPSKILADHLFETAIKSNKTFDLENVTSLQNVSNGYTEINNITYEDLDYETSNLNWGETFAGTILGLSQVYGLNNVPCATLMYLALFIYSPLMTGFAYLGSLIGTLIGISFAKDVAEVYAGVWGYNGLLCSAALAGFCFVLNLQSALIAILSIFFTTALQHFMTPFFIRMNLPVLTMPFNLTTILFLFVTTEKETTLPRPHTITYPEDHRHQFDSWSKGIQQGYLCRPKNQDTEEKEDE